MRVFGKIRDIFAEDASWGLFLVFAFLSMTSMPLARAALAAALVATLASRGARRRLVPTGPAAGWLAYLLLAAVVSAIAAHIDSDPLLVPAKGLRKLTKLLWYAAIPVCAAQVTSARRFRATLLALVSGGCVLAASVLLLHTSFAWLQVHYPEGAATAGTPPAAALLKDAACALGLDGAMRSLLTAEVWAPWGGRPPCFLYALTFNATLHDAQRLMVALVCATALATMGRRERDESFPGAGRLLRVAPFLLAAGLVVTCKRAPLLAAVAAVGGVLAALSGAKRALLAVLAVCALAVAVPQSRARLAMLPREFEANSGGRALMWTRIAPQLHREHPWGIGFRSLTDAKMRSIDRHVEPNRTHLHSSPLQAFIDFGWAGLAVWAVWMALAFRAAARTARGAGGCSALPVAVRAAPLAALAALVAVALVEYNIADAAVVLLYGSVMGLSDTALAKAAP